MSEPGTRTVRVRRGPRVWSFVGLGAVVGLVVAVVLAFALPQSSAYSPGQVAGFLGLLGAAIGVLAGGALALVLDAVSRRRARTTVAERDRIRVAPDEEP